jgi:hypothetical protein
MSTTPFLSAVPTSNGGIAFGPPMKLTWTLPLPAALTRSTNVRKVFV